MSKKAHFESAKGSWFDSRAKQRGKLMAAKKRTRKKKSAGKKKSQDFWDKLLSASKVKRILEAMDVNPAQFQKKYEGDTSRGPTGPRELTEKQLSAIKAFQKSGDVEALMKGTGKKSKQSAFNLVAAALVEDKISLPKG